MKNVVSLHSEFKLIVGNEIRVMSEESNIISESMAMCYGDTSYLGMTKSWTGNDFHFDILKSSINILKSVFGTLSKLVRAPKFDADNLQYTNLDKFCVFQPFDNQSKFLIFFI